jgi:hypothetical protein
VKQPAVLGRIVYRPVSMKSSRDRPSLSRSRSRRTATVTTSVPDASSASAMISYEPYLPVPTISRLWIVTGPSRRGSTVLT